VKNINSFSFVKKAIDFEVARHTEIRKTGGLPKQETRGYVEDRGVTLSQRSKEDAMDYRYFPEPDIPPLRFTDTEIGKIAAMIPELPDAAAKRVTSTYGLPDADVVILTETKERLALFEDAVREAKAVGLAVTPKAVANLMINKKVEAADAKSIITSLKTAIDASDCPVADIEAAVGRVLMAQSKAVADYKSGKTTVIMFLLGMVKRELKGKGDAKVIEDTLKAKLS